MYSVSLVAIAGYQEIMLCLGTLAGGEQVDDDNNNDSKKMPATMDPPEEFLCPISGKLMEDPVIMFQSGITYDRKEIESWFITNNSDQNFNEAVPLIAIEKQIAPNMVLRQQVREWRRARNLPIPAIKDRMYDEFTAKRGVIWPLAEEVEYIGADGRPKTLLQPSHLVTTLWTSIPHLPPPAPSPPAPRPSPSPSPPPSPPCELPPNPREIELSDFRRPGFEETQARRDCELSRWRWRSARKVCLDFALFPLRLSLTVVLWLPVYSLSSLLDLASSMASRDGCSPQWVQSCVGWTDSAFDWIWPLEQPGYGPDQYALMG